MNKSSGTAGGRSGIASNAAYCLDSYPGHIRRDLESASKENIVSHYGIEEAVCQTRYQNGSREDYETRESGDVIYVGSSGSPNSANHQVTVLAEHGKSTTLSKQALNRSSGRLSGSGIIVTREIEFSVSAS